MVFDNRIIPYGIPSFLLIDNGPQFVAKLVGILCFDLKAEHFTTTWYHPQTRDQVVHYKKTLITLMHHNISIRQRDLDEYVQPLAYALSTHVRILSVSTPFRLFL